MNKFQKVLPKVPVHQIHFLCLGTDRSTGDSLGPIVGSHLERLGFNVTGTLDEPCHAMNLAERAALIPENKTVIAIDACLGQSHRVGVTTVNFGGLTPGSGVGKSLGEYGDFNIKGIVNVGGFMEYFVLQNTRLRLVMQMADGIVAGICSVYNPASALVAVGIDDREVEL